MKKYRLIKRGHRKITEGVAKGMIMPCGWIIEKLELVDNSWTWVYVDTMHPDDAQAFIDKKERKYSDAELLDWIQVSPNPRISIVIDNWKKCNGGVDLRSAIEYSILTRPNSGAEAQNEKRN
jgi:hypothetical protein